MNLLHPGLVLPETGARSQASHSAPIYPVQIAGTGCFLPPTILTSREIDERAGKPAGWAESLCAIRQRHVVVDETVVDMATVAARRALRAAHIAPGDLQCIIATGALPHQAIPTTAVLVQRRLGLEGTGIPSFDVNATCLGFLAALDTAAAMITARRYTTVLVVAADVPSRGTSWDTPDVKAMFGDGAAAAVLCRSSDIETGILAIALETYSEGAEACEMRAGGSGIDPHTQLDLFLKESWFRMDGPLAYRISLREMPGFLDRLLSSAGVALQDIDVVVPHQASAFALNHMRRRLGVPATKLINILATHGNQVAASLPSALNRTVEEGTLRRGGLALLIGTAAGITLGGAILRF